LFDFQKKGHDPSPYEFPIFNVSHNPLAPYPNPINHLYDKRYKEAYSTFIKQDQPPPANPQQTEPSTPTSPSSSQPTNNRNPPSYSTYPQGQSQQLSNKQASPSPASIPHFRQPPTAGWQYMNPYATMPRSHAAYYQQQALQKMPPIQEQSFTNNSQPVRRSSTGEDIRSNSLSRSTSSNEFNYHTNTGPEKIRVRVINDNSASSSTTDPQYPTNRSNMQRSSLKSNNSTDDNQEVITTRRIYAAPNTEIGAETMEDLLKVVDNRRSESTQSTSSPVTERIIIIDRRGAGTPDDNSNAAGKERYRTFEVRTSTGGVTPSTPPVTSTATASTPAPTNSTSSAAYTMPQPSTTSLPAYTMQQPSTTSLPAYTMQQPNYYPVQQLFYQRPKRYMSVPNNLYSAATPYVAGANNFYPFTYYRY
jgi:hypothetical protein